MKLLPTTKASPVLRTDFSDQVGWEQVCDKIAQSSPEGFLANVDFIDDRDFDGIGKHQLLAAVPKDYPHTFILVVDHRTLSDGEHPVLVVNLYDGLGSETGDEFRALPSEVQSIENNLSIANMDFAEFAEAVDNSGVFRGF